MQTNLSFSCGRCRNSTLRFSIPVQLHRGWNIVEKCVKNDVEKSTYLEESIGANWHAHSHHGVKFESSRKSKFTYSRWFISRTVGKKIFKIDRQAKYKQRVVIFRRKRKKLLFFYSKCTTLKSPKNQEKLVWITGSWSRRRNKWKQVDPDYRESLCICINMYIYMNIYIHMYI